MRSRLSKLVRLIFVLTLCVLASCARQSSSGQRPLPAPEGASSSSAAHWRVGPTIGKSDLLALDFIDNQTGWAVGEIDTTGQGGAIYFTTDGGTSWQAIAKTIEVLAAVCFLNKERGWVAGYAGRIERTDDGGKTWKTQRAEQQGEVFNSIFFIDERQGWAVGGAAGKGGLIFRTTDGGDLWEPVETGRVESFWAVRFSSPQRGWLVGEDGIIMASTDGGKTWSPQFSGTSHAVLSLSLTSSNSLIAVGEVGTILRSADGLQWDQMPAPTTETLNSIAADEHNRLWAVGTRGITITSVDGGLTWSTVASVSSRDLIAVAVTDAAHAVAVGSRGVSQVLQSN